jgi:PAS domain-containing protein
VSSPQDLIRRAVGSDLPSKASLEEFGILELLALVHDAVVHLIGPIYKLPAAIPILERIAQAVEEKRDATDAVALLYRDEQGLFRVAAEEMFRDRTGPVAVVQHDHHFVSANDSYLKLFEFSRRQIGTVRLTDLLDEKDKERFLQANQLLFSGKKKSLVFVGQRMTAKGNNVTTKSTAWSISSSNSARPEYVAAVVEKLAARHESMDRIAQCSEMLLKDRDRLRFRAKRLK